MKKTYIEPSCEAITIQKEDILAGSQVFTITNTEYNADAFASKVADEFVEVEIPE